MKRILQIWRWLNGYKTEPMPEVTKQIAFSNAVICGWCRTISNTTGETCPGCLQNGTLFNVARAFNRNPNWGRINYVYRTRITSEEVSA